MSQPTQPYVFISYTSTERDRALAVAAALEAAGVRVWIDRQAIKGGASWTAAIVRAVQNCAVFAVLSSAQAYASPNVQRELNLAVEENKPVLPLLLEQTVAPPEVRYALAGRQWVEPPARRLAGRRAAGSGRSRGSACHSRRSTRCVTSA